MIVLLFVRFVEMNINIDIKMNTVIKIPFYLREYCLRDTCPNFVWVRCLDHTHCVKHCVCDIIDNVSDGRKDRKIKNRKYAR